MIYYVNENTNLVINTPMEATMADHVLVMGNQHKDGGMHIEYYRIMAILISQYGLYYIRYYIHQTTRVRVIVCVTHITTPVCVPPITAGALEKIAETGVRCTMRKGDMIMMDSRALHRGTVNPNPTAL